VDDSSYCSPYISYHNCDRLDDSLSFISSSTVLAAMTNNFNLRDKFGEVYETNNPVFIGIDVAEKVDLFSLVAFEELEYADKSIHYKQVYLDYFNGKTIPELEEYCIEVINMFPTTSVVWVDETGVGSGLVGYLKKKFGTKIRGINFAKRVYIGDGGETMGIRTTMLTNLKRCMENKQVTLINDTSQLAHMTAVDYSLKVIRGADTGHGDILFANALALLKSRYTAFERQSTDISRLSAKSESDTKEFSVLDKIQHYKKEAKRRLKR
jgi:hypothetical protein